MKERIEFITESSIKGRKEIAKINEHVNNFNFDCAFEREIEQVPESWEELKELVNKYSGKINRQVGGITVGTIRIIIMMKFDNK